MAIFHFKMMKKVALIEDHPLMTSGMKSMIQSIWKEVPVVTFDKIELLEKHLQQDQELAYIIADVHLGDLNILERLMLLQIENKRYHIILYTSSHPWELGLDKNNFPFFGYIQKGSDLQTLINCLHAIEENYSSPFFQEDLIWANPHIKQSEQTLVTKREREILLLIKGGKTNKEIGDILFLSELTIKSHRQNMMRKFECKNVAELIAKTVNI